jgi:hypothetical protein
MTTTPPQPTIDFLVSNAMSGLRAYKVAPISAARAVLENVIHKAYQLGYDQMLASLRTTAQVAVELGITADQVRHLATGHGAGWRIGQDMLFRPEDVAILRAVQQAAAKGVGAEA